MLLLNNNINGKLYIVVGMIKSMTNKRGIHVDVREARGLMAMLAGRLSDAGKDAHFVIYADGTERQGELHGKPHNGVVRVALYGTTDLAMGTLKSVVRSAGAAIAQDGRGYAPLISGNPTVRRYAQSRLQTEYVDRVCNRAA